MAHRYHTGETKQIPAEFSKGAGFTCYWEGDLHIVKQIKTTDTESAKKSARKSKELQKSEDEGLRYLRSKDAQEAETSTYFPMCIAMAIRMYEAYSGPLAEPTQESTTSPQIRAATDVESVLPDKLKAKFNELLSRPEVDPQQIEKLLKAREAMTLAGLPADAMTIIDEQIKAQQSLAASSSRRPFILELKERAIAIFGKRGGLGKTPNLEADPDYIKAPRRIQAKFEERTLTESEWTEMPYFNDWDCSLDPVSSIGPRSLTENRQTGVAISRNELSNMVAEAENIRMTLSAAKQQMMANTFSALSDSAPFSPDVTRGREIIQEIEPTSGKIVNLEILTPQQITELDQFTQQYNQNFEGYFRITALDFIQARKIKPEVYHEHQQFIDGIRSRNEGKEPGEQIQLQVASDYKLIEIIITGNKDIEKLSKVVDIKDLLESLKRDQKSPEIREKIITQFATVMYMATEFRAQRERELSPAAGELAEKILEHYEQNRATIGEAAHSLIYLTRMMGDLYHKFKDVGTLTLKQIDLIDNLSGQYATELSDAINTRQAGMGQDVLPLHTRQIP